MARTKLKFRLHRAVIVLFCLALLVALMQGASWFSQNHQRQRNPQLEELARTLARQVTLNVAPLMRTDSPDEKRIQAILDQLTDESRILDAGVYDEQGDLIARSGESVEVRDRLALDGKKAGWQKRCADSRSIKYVVRVLKVWRLPPRPFRQVRRRALWRGVWKI